MENKIEKKAPTWLSHTPVVTVDYETKDAQAGDAKFLSLGRSTWNDEDFSAKIWRWSEDAERWSRQGEEIPLWRVLDLATLLVAEIVGEKSALDEFAQLPNEVGALKDYINDNMVVLEPRLAELKRLLNSNGVHNEKSGTPNLFSYATSELSQDAIIAWIISWADVKYREVDACLHRVAQSFLRLLMGKDESFIIEGVKVGRQWRNIDIWAEINDKSFLIIEDKTGTTIHDEQLERYKSTVQECYAGQRTDLFYAYVKTGNEPKSILDDVQKKGYLTISRKDIIDCLSQYNGQNNILLSFVEHLSEEEADTLSFKSKPVKEWSWFAWEGFYKELERNLDIDSWGYVSNPAGGFLGAWWHFTDFAEGQMYLQIEQGKLCFKICYEGNGDRSAIRWRCHEQLLNLAGDKYPEICRPARFGAGIYMTIAVVSADDLFGTGILDNDRFISKILQYQLLIDKCCSELK